ncbi:MAG: cytochrome c3 family protein [Anaerolineales bacterium]
MRAGRLGCLTGTGIIAALIATLAIVGVAVASGGSMFSPGSLNAVQGHMLGGVSSHAEIAGNCGLCHTAPWEKETMGDRCMACHTDISAQMGDVLTEHGRMYRIDPKVECRDCHPEHNGATALLTVLDGWRYPHELSGYMLTAHQLKAEKEPFVCADCHVADVTVFDINICSNCHQQRNTGFMTNHIEAYGAACLNCHDGVDSLGQHFTHDKFAFKLTGKHLAVSCEGCHAGVHSVDEYKKTAQDCASCHTKDDPHDGTLGNDCASCHTPEDWKAVHFDHNRSVFKLTAAHINVACSDCHTNNLFKGTPMDCFSCHKGDDPHKGLLGQTCESCHQATTWKDVKFDHSQSSFHLVGKHIGVPCESCHKDLLFKGTPMDCASCHKDPHAGQMGRNCTDCHNPSDWKDVHFDHSLTGFPLNGGHGGLTCANCHANGVYRGTPSSCFSCHAKDDHHNGQFGTDCASCHVPTKWSDVHFDHATTGFKLAGSHAKVPCTSCHVNNTYKGTPTNCYACHAKDDHHNGEFGTDCASCHKPTKWSEVTFDHANTGFPLTGQHGNVQCKACHANGYKGTPTNCFACHAKDDNHNGQFGTDCGSCHTTKSWAGATFDHSMTGFPLIGKHAGAPCQSCHSNGYKGTPTNCYACHAKDDNHNGQFGTDCGTCHTPKGWGGASFNHSITGFPLDGKHAGLNCTKCHSGGSYSGLSPSCTTCHEDKHNGQNGPNCTECHTTKTWSK